MGLVRVNLKAPSFRKFFTETGFCTLSGDINAILFFAATGFTVVLSCLYGGNPALGQIVPDTPLVDP